MLPDGGEGSRLRECWSETRAPNRRPAAAPGDTAPLLLGSSRDGAGASPSDRLGGGTAGWLRRRSSRAYGGGMLVLEELTSRELELVLERGTTTAVIPFGSVEHQGRHLPLGSDALLADVVGEAVADRLDAVLAPTLRVGSADQHVSGKGTLTVPPETLREVALHIARSLIAQGFRILVLLSTHAGNRGALEQAAQELHREHPDIEVCVPQGDVGADPGTHSGRWITSVMLLLRPDLVDVKSAHDDIKDEALAATPQTGEKNLERFISSIVQAVPNASPGTVDSLPK